MHRSLCFLLVLANSPIPIFQRIARAIGVPAYARELGGLGGEATC